MSIMLARVTRTLPASADPRKKGRGQALVEFALLMPLLSILIMGLIEFGLAFNATLGINRASQNAALIASEAGNIAGADCLILRSVERDVTVPNDLNQIVEVQVQRTGPGGGVIYASNVYARGGSTTCTLNDGTTVTVGFTVSSTGYPVSQRCAILEGCPTLTPPRSTVDTIGVQVRYRYDWKTPLGALMRLIDGTGPGTSTWTFQKRSVFRMEPQL
jgi:Flp pilus assembly protein TadG